MHSDRFTFTVHPDAKLGGDELIMVPSPPGTQGGDQSLFLQRGYLGPLGVWEDSHMRVSGRITQWRNGNPEIEYTTESV